MHALRVDGSPQALATAALLKRGVTTLDIGPLGGSRAGEYVFGTNVLRIDPSKFSSIQRAAGVTAHETKHFLQKLTPSSYRQVHELEAFQWQRAVDRSFQMSDDQIWNLIRTDSNYLGLKP